MRRVRTDYERFGGAMPTLWQGANNHGGGAWVVPWGARAGDHHCVVLLGRVRAMSVSIGLNIVYGVHKPKPLVNFPAGKVRIRQRNTDFVRVYVKPPTGGVRSFCVVDEYGAWCRGPEQGSNTVVGQGKPDRAQ